MTALRHQLHDDGRVLVTVVGDRPLSVHVEADEVRRFAWSVLADLDPEGAEDAGYVAAAVPRPYGDPDRERARWGSQIAAICAFLEGRQANTTQIANLLGVSGNHAAIQMLKLERRGLVKRVKRGSPGDPSIWAAGEITLSECRARLDRG